jgi:hypothetical protein
MEKEKGRRRKENGEKKRGAKRERKGDARRPFSQRRPRLVGRARTTFARCARRKRIASALIAERQSRVVVGPPSGAGWDSGQVRCRSEGVRARVLTTSSF